MAHEVVISRTAQRQLQRLPTRIQARARDAILALGDSPRPSGTVKLAGRENEYRIRVSDYRIVYEIHDDVLLVLIVAIGHRRDIYR